MLVFSSSFFVLLPFQTTLTTTVESNNIFHDNLLYNLHAKGNLEMVTSNLVFHILTYLQHYKAAAEYELGTSLSSKRHLTSWLPK